MKNLLMVLVTVGLISYCYTKSYDENNEKETSKRKKMDQLFYVTNWDQYQLPKPVQVDSLKNILTKIGLYRQNRYCPFGENQCDPVKVLYKDVKKIIEDKGLRCDEVNFVQSAYSNEIESDTDMYGDKSIGIKSDNKEKVLFRTRYGDHINSIPYYDMVSPRIRSNMIEVLILSNGVHNRDLRNPTVSVLDHQYLYGPSYKKLTAKKKNRRPIKKSFSLMACSRTGMENIIT